MTCCWSHEPHQRASFAVLKKLMDEVCINMNFFFTCCQALYNNTSVWKKKIKINNDNHYHKLNLNHNHNHSHNNHNHKIWHLLILLSYCVGLRYVHQCRELCKIKTQSIYIFFSRLTLWMVLLFIPMKAKAHQIWVFKQEISSRCLMPGRYRTNKFLNEFFAASAFVVGL